MIPDLARTLTPLQEAVATAEGALDAHNADPAANPLDGLHHAGRVIHAHEALGARMHDLLDVIGTAGEHDTILAIHGRLSRLAQEKQ